MSTLTMGKTNTNTERNRLVTGERESGASLVCGWVSDMVIGVKSNRGTQ